MAMDYRMIQVDFDNWQFDWGMYSCKWKYQSSFDIVLFVILVIELWPPTPAVNRGGMPQAWVSRHCGGGLIELVRVHSLYRTWYIWHTNERTMVIVIIYPIFRQANCGETFVIIGWLVAFSEACNVTIYLQKMVEQLVNNNAETATLCNTFYFLVKWINTECS